MGLRPAYLISVSNLLVIVSEWNTIMGKLVNRFPVVSGVNERVLKKIEYMQKNQISAETVNEVIQKS